jgi:hypothetical protein
MLSTLFLVIFGLPIAIADANQKEKEKRRRIEHDKYVEAKLAELTREG